MRGRLLCHSVWRNLLVPFAELPFPEKEKEKLVGFVPFPGKHRNMELSFPKNKNDADKWVLWLCPRENGKKFEKIIVSLK